MNESKPTCLGDQSHCGTEKWEGCAFSDECDSIWEKKEAKRLSDERKPLGPPPERKRYGKSEARI